MKLNYIAACCIVALAGIGNAGATVKSVNPALHGAKGNGFFLSEKSEKPMMLGAQKSMLQKKAKAAEGAERPTGAGYGTLTGPDGSVWFYTGTYEMNPSNQFYYSKAEFKVYDSNAEFKGSVTVDVPDGELVNNIVPYGTITNKFFDLDANSYELVVSSHIVEVGTPGTYRQEVFSLGGEKKMEFSARNMFFFNASEGWTNYDRLIMEYTEEEDGISYYAAKIYKPCEWGKTEPEVENTFRVEAQLLDYAEGAYINWYKVDGDPYYVVSHYEKPYASGEDASGELVLTENNHYILEVYDKNYNQVKKLTLPIVKSANALYGLCAFGYFSYEDLCRGVYSGDDKLNLIVTNIDYMSSSDSYLYNFNVYDEDGNFVKTIASGVEQWQELSPIVGQPDQVAFMRTVGDMQEIQMVNMPGGELVTTFPGMLNDELLSTSFDRYPKDDTYQYVFSMGSAAADADNNVIARVGWYNIDLSLDHYVSFNLGKDAEYASAYITTDALDPYIIDTDNSHEYIFISKMKNSIGQLDNVLSIGKDDGSILRKFSSDSEGAGIYANGALVNLGTNSPKKLLVVYSNTTTGDYTLDLLDLPLVKFSAGGEGTAASPYKISTPGDIRQIENAPTAHYELANDINMGDYLGYFDPVASFTGNLDGKGYYINNLILDGSHNYAGLFSSLGANSVVKDLNFNNVLFNGDASTCISAGALAGSAIQTTINNVHVYGAQFLGDDNYGGNIGGIVGEASLNSKITACSVNELEIDAENASRVGGIVGNTRTGTVVSAATVSGEISAKTSVGGIVGEAGTDVEISDSYADVNLSASNTVGGIAGYSSRGPISNCFALGTIEATEGDFNGNYNAGGIIGAISSDWSKAEDIVLSNCVALQSSIVAPEAKAVHRIAGFTIADEQYEPEETPWQEIGFSSNYAISNLSVVGATVTSDDNTTVEGASVTSVNTDFFTGLGYKFGSDAENPWKAAASSPILFFEEKATGITLDKTTADVVEGRLFELVATVEGTSAAKVEFDSSNDEIADVVSTVVEGNKVTAKIRYYGGGDVVITASVDGISATCQVKAAGVDEIAGNDGFAIIYSGSSVYAVGADKLELYSINGNRVAYVAGDSLDVAGLGSGIYVAVATKADGTRKVEKVAVK